MTFISRSVVSCCATELSACRHPLERTSELPHYQKNSPFSSHLTCRVASGWILRAHTPCRDSKQKTHKVASERVCYLRCLHQWSSLMSAMPQTSKLSIRNTLHLFGDVFDICLCPFVFVLFIVEAG